MPDSFRFVDNIRLGLFVIAALLAWSFARFGFAAESSHPNILLIIADDLRPQLGCYGDKIVKTPHIDAFAKTATRFNLAFAQSAVCSPSRNSFLSGMRPATTGLTGFGTSLRSALPDIVTLPQHFKNHDYDSVGFGKIYHIYAESMLGNENDPHSWSQPHYLPTVPVWGPAQTVLRERLIAAARDSGKAFEHPHDWPRARTWDDSDVADNQMQDGQTTDVAIDFLHSRAGTDQPFFAAVGFFRPHLPFNAPKRFWDIYEPNQITLPSFRDVPVNSWRWTVSEGIVKNYFEMPPFETIDRAFLKRYLQAYLACISYVDQCVGRLVKTLEENSLADNTIVILMGDHGYQMGEYDSWGHKHSNYEISTRTPLIIRAPKNTTAKIQSVDKVVELMDLYPTLCELSELPQPEHLEGQSFAKLLIDSNAKHHDAACSEMRRNRGLVGHSIRTAGFRYTEWTNKKSVVAFRELYDHRGDDTPGQLETENVVDQPEMQGIATQLGKRLHERFARAID
ncbi:MAG: sulfatase [Planctomycetota bacterium]